MRDKFHREIDLVYYFMFLLLWSPFASTIVAENYTYTALQSNTISSTVFSAGDTVTLRKGIWNDVQLKCRGNGLTNKPVVFIAEEAGEVRLTGSSTLTIEGSNVEVSGLYFIGPTTMTGSHIVMFSPRSTDCRFTNSAIKDYYPTDSATWETRNTKYVSLYGKNNRVDHCYFENKTNLGTLLVVWLKNGVTANHRIDNNHFYKRDRLFDENGLTVNGQEIIRIGDSSTSGTTASCIVESNFFEECNGEGEIISNKSCGNIYRNNVFYKSQGALTLRHGHNCQVYGNCFLGGGISLTGGVRIIGEDHFVYNNYFQDLMGTGFIAALCMVTGNEDFAGYQQVKNATVVFNTFYNCNYALHVGYLASRNLLPPINTTIAHNVVHALKTLQTGAYFEDRRAQVDWHNNVMYLGRFRNFTPTDEQFAVRNIPFSFVESNTEYVVYRPSSESILAEYFRTTEYPTITADIFGNKRPEERTIGAFEISEEITVPLPTPRNVGCSFINKSDEHADTSLQDVPDFIGRISIRDNFLEFNSSVQIEQLKIYNLKGELVAVPFVINNGNEYQAVLPGNLKGLYLIEFNSRSGNNIVKKFIL